MEPTRRRSGVKSNSESLGRLHDEIRILRAQLTKAKATIARLSQGNGSKNCGAPGDSRLLMPHAIGNRPGGNGASQSTSENSHR